MIDLICELDKCTGCGMCVNICPKNAISMVEGLHGFDFPNIDNNLCVNCYSCVRNCPSNNSRSQTDVLSIYAAWNKSKVARKESTSGGIFSLLAESIIDDGGVVAGVAWNDLFLPQHIIVENKNDLSKFRGSKYSQSNTGKIYVSIRKHLEAGQKVLFSGTPCQNAALKFYLNKEYDNLFLIDVVCHGVPSNQMLLRYYQQFRDTKTNVILRYKKPFWDYCFVRIDFRTQKSYQKLTIEDSYFNLFNLGYSLRQSCHNCSYTSIHRESDITLADYWGYSAHSFQTRNYNKGVSLILTNSKKGEELVASIRDKCFIEKSSLEQAVKGNKCLSEPFRVDENILEMFWNDYDNGMSVNDLNEKYAARVYKLPSFLTLRRLYKKYKWLIKR